MITSNSNWIASCIWLQLPGISQTARHWQRHQLPLARHSWQPVWGPWQNQGPMGREAPVHALPPVGPAILRLQSILLDSSRLIKKGATHKHPAAKAKSCIIIMYNQETSKVINGYKRVKFVWTLFRETSGHRTSFLISCIKQTERCLWSSLFSETCGQTSAVWCQQIISCIGLALAAATISWHFSDPCGTIYQGLYYLISQTYVVSCMYANVHGILFLLTPVLILCIYIYISHVWYHDIYYFNYDALGRYEMLVWANNLTLIFCHFCTFPNASKDAKKVRGRSWKDPASSGDASSTWLVKGKPMTQCTVCTGTGVP